MSLEQWAELPEDEPGELVDGVLTEEEVPDYAHEVVVSWLIALFWAWVMPRGGVVGGSEAKFAVRATRGRKPDVTVFVSRKPPRRGVVRVPPDIAVEVVSPTPRDARRDRIEKMDEYAAFGVRFYWLLDPQERTFEVYELAESGRYSRALGAADGTVKSIPGCEGLTVDLDALWKLVDSLPDEG
jgi:Uma2 family endonuclease